MSLCAIPSLATTGSDFIPVGRQISTVTKFTACVCIYCLQSDDSLLYLHILDTRIQLHQELLVKQEPAARSVLRQPTRRIHIQTLAHCQTYSLKPLHSCTTQDHTAQGRPSVCPIELVNNSALSLSLPHCSCCFTTHRLLQAAARPRYSASPLRNLCLRSSSHRRLGATPPSPRLVASL